MSIADIDVAARSRTARLTKRILSKLITNEILKLVCQAQAQHVCEGCLNDWKSQWGHKCLFYGMNPEYCLLEFVSEYFEEVVQALDTSLLLSVCYCSEPFGSAFVHWRWRGYEHWHINYDSWHSKWLERRFGGCEHFVEFTIFQKSDKLLNYALDVL